MVFLFLGGGGKGGREKFLELIFQHLTYFFPPLKWRKGKKQLCNKLHRILAFLTLSNDRRNILTRSDPYAAVKSFIA